jgi:FMN phosphatase YigB (HAD superfamily)
MPLTLLKYAEHLDQRGEPKPAGPEPQPFASAKPHVTVQPVRAVVWSGFGTLLLSTAGEPELLPADKIMRKIALEKTVTEFKMWASMSRKPGEPSEYLEQMVLQVADKISAANLGSQRTEMKIEAVWLGILERLFKKEYIYDAGFFGPPEEYAAKIALFYQRASQGVAAFPKALATLKAIAAKGLLQGVHANGQQATPVFLQRELAEQGRLTGLGELFDPALCVWSYETGVRSESARGMEALTQAVASKGLEPDAVLVIGSDMDRDLAPAKKAGFRTGFLAADRATAKVAPAQLKDDKTKPNVLFTAYEQVVKALPEAGASRK